MAQAASREKWAHTASVLALIANANRDPKKTRPFKPSDFDPHATKRTEAMVVDNENIGLLKQAFTKPKE
jgi:hypothetical protein